MGAYDRTTYDGHTVNQRTKAMLIQMADFLGYPLTVLQGSYTSGNSSSAGTHSGGGAVDLAPADWENKVPAGRMVGFAAFHRPYLHNVWPEHIHMIAIGDKQMSYEASKQVHDYYAHLDGLSSHAYDPEWRPTVIVPFHYPLGIVNLANVLEHIHNGAHKPRVSVKQIQRALNIKRGAGLPVDGIYGDKTRAAFKRYERQNGGNGDGIPGALTKKLGLALYRVE